MQSNFYIPFITLFLFQGVSQAKDIPHIIVTPTPKKNEGLYIPSTILTKKSLEKTQQTFVGDAVRQTPGVTSVSTGTEGSVNSIKFRGLNDSHTLVVIDGIPVNSPANTTNFFDFGQYRAVNVKNISILPGSHSLLYGSNAIGGVILIDTLSGEGNPTATLTQEVGRYRFFRTSAKASGQHKKFDYYLTGEKYCIGEGSIWNRKQKLRQSDDFHDYNGSIKMGFQVSPCFHFSGYLSSTMNELKNNSFNDEWLPIESNIYKTKNKSQLGYLKFNWQPSDSLHQLLTVSNLKTKSESFNIGVKDKDVGTRNRIHHQINFRMDDKNLVQLVLEHEADALEKMRQECNHIYQNHIAGTYEFKPVRFVTLGFGVRETYHSTFKRHRSYQVSGKLNFEATELFASFGTGFRSPSLYQLYGTNTSMFSVLPNKDLKPEKSQGFDGGIEQGLAPIHSKVRLIYFIIRVNDIINWDNTLSQYKNTNKRSTHGMESKLKTDFTKEINSQINYTYTRGIDSDTKRHPLKIPQHKLGLSLYYCPKNWSNFIEGTFHSASKDFGDKKIGAYFIMRVGSGYEINDNIKVFGRVENLLDRIYEQTSGYATRGRSFIGGITLKL